MITCKITVFLVYSSPSFQIFFSLQREKLEKSAFCIAGKKGEVWLRFVLVKEIGERLNFKKGGENRKIAKFFTGVGTNHQISRGDGRNH